MTRNLRWIIGACLAAGIAGSTLGLILDVKAMLAAYLTVWIAVSAIPIGALGVLLTSYLVRAGWTNDLHTFLSRAALTLPMMAILFSPIMVGLHWLYPWAGDGLVLPAFKAAYLSPTFFVVRSLAYFVILTALAIKATRVYGNDTAMKRIAAVGLIAWALAASFAGVDWLESIEPEFHSSIYGLLMVSFDLLAGFSFALAAMFLQMRSHRMRNAAYGAVLLSLLLLWAYLHAMQYIVIWTADLPDEVVWYLARVSGGWAVIFATLFIGQFVVPFFVLISPRMRRSSSMLRTLAIVTLTFRLVEATVLILPPLHVAGFVLLLDIPAAILLIGSAWALAWHERYQFLAIWRSRRPAAAH